MKLKDRIKTYNFWVSLSSAIFLFLKVLGNQIGFSVNENLFSDLITSLCGILVILGIIVPPSYKNNDNIIQDKDETNNSQHVVCDSEKNKELETVSDLTLENASSNSQNEPILEFNDDLSTSNNSNENIIEHNDCKTSSVDESDNLNIEELKLQVSKTLSNQEKLLEGYSSIYIELLQTQINNMLNK